MSKRPLQASIAPDFLFKGRIDVHDTKSFLLAFIAPDFSENFLNKLETFSMRARHITGLAHNGTFKWRSELPNSIKTQFQVQDSMLANPLHVLPT